MNILIHSLEHGYVITDHDSGKKYAKETAEGVIEVIKEALEISVNPAMTGDVKLERPETEINSQSKIETNWSTDSSLPTPEPKPEPTACQKIKELAQIKEPDGLLISRFKYDPWQAQKKEIEGYSNISVMELPDGRAMIQYKGTHYYTTKEKVMQIPYPTPYSYFKRPGLGVSPTAQTCLRAYRKHLGLCPEDCTQRTVTQAYLRSADRSLKSDSDEINWKDESGSIAFRENEQKLKEAGKKPVGDEQGTCDDVIFDSCANNSPENCKFCVNQSRFEDKNKLAAKKPAPPLMHATIEP